MDTKFSAKDNNLGNGKPEEYIVSKELADLEKEAIEKYFKVVLDKKDDVSLILTAHLYIEYWIELFVRYSLPKPEKILDSVNLTFMGETCPC